MNPAPLRRRPGGFTLIELLTVIAIIGILAAIIIPTVGRVRNSARQAQCASNLRQIGTATLMWYQENSRSKLRPIVQRTTASGTENISWISALLPYLNTRVAGADQYGSAPELTHCPSSPPTQSWQRNSYGINRLTDDTRWLNGISAIREPARTILAGDVVGTTLSNTNNAFQAMRPTGFGDSDPADTNRFATRHGGETKGNVVFFDAHVELIDRTKYDWNEVGAFTTSAPANPWKPW